MRAVVLGVASGVAVLACSGQEAPPPLGQAGGTSASGGSDAGSGGNSAEGGNGPGESRGQPNCSTTFAAVESRARPGAELNEVSGLVAGRLSDFLYAHNDSGDVPRVFALNRQGEIAASFSITGVGAIDWEDIAARKDDQGQSWLYLSDTGDNDQQRSTVQLIRVAEPQDPVAATGSLPGESFDLVFPQGARNVESLLIDPLNDEIVLVTKQVPAEIYAVDASELRADTKASLRFVGNLGVDGFFAPSGGDVSFDGRAVALRGSTAAYLWEREPEVSIAELLTQSPCALPLAEESQGESLAFSEEGGFFTLSELNDPLHWIALSE